MTDELLHHWALHELDEEAVLHQAELAKLPDQRRALEARVAAERRRLDALIKHAAELQVRRRQLERDIDVLETQEKKYRAQLDAVTNQQQFEAAQHEIAGAHAKRSDRETEALALMEGEERAAAEKPGLEDVLAKAERETGETLQRLAAAETRLRARLGELDATRAATLLHFDPPSRQRYEKIRGSRAGRAVSAIERGACGGCFRGQPPHALQEARKRDHLLMCDGCGRLLMLPPEGHAGA